MDYLGIRHQALLDMADWCEKGIAPVPSTNYRVNDGQIEIPAGAAERGGLQPVTDAYANGKKCVTVKAGEAVVFTADIETLPGAGKVTAAAWDYEKTDDFSEFIPFEKSGPGRVIVE